MTPETPAAPDDVADRGLRPRNLRFDLADHLAGDWHGGDPFRTAFLNALSLNFPAERVAPRALDRGRRARQSRAAPVRQDPE